MRRLVPVAPVLTLVVLTLVGARPVLAGTIPVGGTAKTAGGAAVAEAWVELIPLLSNYDRSRMLLEGRATPEPVATSKTDASGRFSLEAPGAGVRMVVVRAAGFIPMRYAPLPLVSPTELPPVTLLRDAEARIEILDDSGDPAAGVWVYAESGSKSLWSGVAANGWRAEARIGRSDETGRLTLPRAPGERLTITAFSPHGGVAGHVEALERTTLVLDRTTELRVIEVCDGQGEPFPEILVAAGDLAWPAGRTGRDGRLNVAGDLSRPVKLQLFAADGRRQTVELQPPHKDDEGPARFVLTPPVRTAGRIIAAAGRRPLAAALIWPAHDPGTFVLTDSRGAYELMAPPDDRFSVHAQAAGFLPQAQGVRGGGSTERAPTLALTAAAAVTGQVVDRTGAPLPGVLLAATTLPPAQRPRSFHPDRADSRAASDARGGFTLGNLHPQAAHELTAAKAGFATATVTIDDFDRTASPERLRIVMEKARPAFGRVIDSAEQPVPGAEVRLRAAAPGSQDEPVTGLSDETGRFDLATVPGPRVDIEAQKKGFSPLTVRGVEVPAGKVPVDLGTLILGPGVMLRGLVVDTGDEPVAGAEVRVAEDDGRRASFVLRRLEGDQPRTATGPDGRFRIEDLEPGRKFHLLFRRAGYLPARVLGVEAPNSEPVVAVLEPASTLSGRVVDEDGAAIAGARVSVRGQDPPTGTVGVELRHRDVSRTVATDQKGDFVIAELPPGKVEIEAAAAGFQPAPPQYVGIPAATSLDNLRFVLERGAVVEGRVSTAEGEPVAGARIRMAHARAASDADGIYRLEGIPLGKQFLTVGHLEFKRTARRLDVEPGVNLADVVLEGGWRVAGRVVDDDGTALEGARVELRLERMREMRQYEATSEADGQFSFPRVVDGSYDVAAEKSGYGGVELRRGLEVAGGSVEDLEVVLPSGASVVGRLLGLEFEELATAEVEAERDEQYGKPGRVDYDGGYEINDLGPGVWLVKARVRGGRRQTEARITIEPGGGRVTRDLEFGRGLTLTGRVSYGGVLLPETSVSVRGYDVAVSRSVVTDHQGAFRIQDLRPGRYRLGVANHPEQLLHNEDLELVGDRELLIEIATAQVSGSVISATSSRSLADALIYMQQLLGDGSQPGSLITVATDPEGAFAFGRLSAGRYRLTVRKDGYAPFEQILDVEAGAVVDALELLLSPTQGLDIIIRLASGRSPSPATVSVLDPSGRLVLTETRNVGPDGYVRFATVPPGTWDLVLSAPGAAVTRATATVPGESLELVLADGARLAVRVPALVESNQVAALTLLGQNGRPFQGLGPTRRLRRQWSLSGGTGVVEGVPAGMWTVRAVATDGQFWERIITTGGGSEYEVVLE